MKNIGGNLERLKIKNRQLILRLLNNHGKMSRKLIAQTISLTSASITQLCSEMIAEGLIVEVGEDETSTKAGRKEIFININYENRYALCINIEKFSTDISLANLQGNVILTKRIKTATRVDAEIFLKQVADTCLAFLEQ
ncbi:MarR family transcriptional regulator, partial [Candidatus Epulonipiscium viviparus]